MRKRIIGLFLALCMTMALMPLSAVSTAAEPAGTDAPEREDIKLGGYLQMGTYYGAPILWRCVDIDENGPLMLADKIICLKPFDAVGGENTSDGSHSRDDFRKLAASNYWADSNIRSWLNSGADAGDVEWLCGNPPDREHVFGGYNAYDDEAGFLTNFTEAELDALKEVEQRSVLAYPEYKADMAETGTEPIRYEYDMEKVAANYDEAYAEYVTDRMFLLDLKQLSVVYGNKEALGEDYYMGEPTAECAENSEYKEEGRLELGKKWHYWLRSAGDDLSSNIRYVYSSARVGSGNGNLSYVGVRPAFYLDTSSADFVSGTGEASDPYTFETAPKPTATVEPVETNTPEPTATVEPAETNTPEPTATVEPAETNTPEPTATAEPVETSTPEPTVTTEPVETNTPQPEATVTAAPTGTPQPTETAAPAGTNTPTRRSSGGFRSSGTPKPTTALTEAPKPTTVPTEAPSTTAAPSAAPSAEPEQTVKPAEDKWFTDVPQNAWYYGSVKYVFENGLMLGVGGTEFMPSADVTRGMFVTVLYRMETEPKTTGGYAFTDVPLNIYYADAVSWASANGIVKGYSDNVYAPDEPITREQAAAILFRYARYKGKDTGAAESADISEYADYGKVSEYALPAVAWMCGESIIAGYDDNTLRPQADIIRAEAAGIIERYITSDK